jgi:hypothetical protein
MKTLLTIEELRAHIESLLSRIGRTHVRRYAPNIREILAQLTFEVITRADTGTCGVATSASGDTRGNILWAEFSGRRVAICWHQGVEVRDRNREGNVLAKLTSAADVIAFFGGLAV